MGGLFSALSKLFTKIKEMRVLMIGLDNAGKTTIAKAMQSGGFVPSSKPTIGFDLQEFSIGNFHLKIWDISGQEKFRSLWKHYYEGAKGVIFVIDAADRPRAAEAREEFQKVLLDPDLSQTKILIFANKQDLPNAMKAKEIRDALGIGFEVASRVRIQEASAKTHEGLVEGFNWLVQETDSKKTGAAAAVPGL